MVLRPHVLRAPWATRGGCGEWLEPGIAHGGLARRDRETERQRVGEEGAHRLTASWPTAASASTGSSHARFERETERQRGRHADTRTRGHTQVTHRRLRHHCDASSSSLRERVHQRGRGRESDRETELSLCPCPEEGGHSRAALTAFSLPLCRPVSVCLRRWVSLCLRPFSPVVPSALPLCLSPSPANDRTISHRERGRERKSETHRAPPVTHRRVTTLPTSLSLVRLSAAENGHIHRPCRSLALSPIPIPHRGKTSRIRLSF